MTISFAQSAAIIAIVAVCTYITRAVPFLLFRGRQLPRSIIYLGNILPTTIMAVLVVYCLKSTTFSSLAGFMPQLISVAVVVLLHVWKRKTLISIVGGTLCYMYCVQVLFL